MTTEAAWDTTVASRLYPGSAALLFAGAAALEGRRVNVPAPAVLEVCYGLARRSGIRGPSLLRFKGIVRGPSVRVVPFGREAGLLAGDLRALQPFPPSTRRGDRRSKPERRLAWLLDLQIGATAYAAGLDVATENRRDYEAIAALIADGLGLEPLAVYDPPV